MSHAPPHSNPASKHHPPQQTPSSSSSNTNTSLLSTFAIFYLILLYFNPRRPLDLLTNILTRLRGMLRLNKTADLLTKVPQAMGTAVVSATGGSEGVTAGVVEKVRKASTGVLARMSGRSDGDVDVPAGLGNWDNSCYQNSVLQSLAGLEAVRPFLRGLVRDVGGEDGGEENTAGSLLETLQRLNDSANNGRQLWTPAKLKKMSSWQQQDAQEYFSKILEELEKEAVKAFSSSPSSSPLSASRGLGLEALLDDSKSTPANKSPTVPTPVKNPLDGLLAQKVTCTRCAHSTGLSLIPFNCLTLPLPLQTEPTDLSACLDEYTKREEIPQVECAKCTLLHAQEGLAASLPSDPGFQSTDLDAAPLRQKVMQLPPELRAQSFQRLALLQHALSSEDFADKTLTEICGISRQERVSSTKTREAMVARAPACLVLHVNRSVFDEMTGVQRKNYVKVGYPLRFGLGKWMRGLDDGEDKVEDESEVGYVLKAVVTHYGRHENGHYICYRRHPRVARDDDATELGLEEEGEDVAVHQQNSEAEEKEQDPWYRLSDEDVTPVAEEDVLSQGGVFMLFYERENLSDNRALPAPTQETVAEHLPVRETPTIATEASLAAEGELDDLHPAITAQALTDAPSLAVQPSPQLELEPLLSIAPSTTTASPPTSGISSPLGPAASAMSTTDYESDSDMYPPNAKLQDTPRKLESNVSSSPVRMRTARGMEDAAVEEGREGDWMFRGVTRVAAT